MLFAYRIMTAVYISLFDVKSHTNVLNKIEKRRYISGLYVGVYILVSDHLLVLSIKMFIAARV